MFHLHFNCFKAIIIIHSISISESFFLDDAYSYSFLQESKKGFVFKDFRIFWDVVAVVGDFVLLPDAKGRKTCQLATP